MPNRIIKESICASDSIESPTWFEEVFFYRLIVNCNDYGRTDARPAILKARLFPLRSVTDKQISDAVNKLAAAGIALVYECGHRPYLQLVAWPKHQNIRTQKSKFPGPEEQPAAEGKPSLDAASNCTQMNADVCNCALNPIR